MLGMAYFGINKISRGRPRPSLPLGTRGMQDSQTGYAWGRIARAHRRYGKSNGGCSLPSKRKPRTNDVLLLIGQLWTEIGDYAKAVATVTASLADGSVVA